MSTLESINLRSNPFRDLTPAMGSTPIWAGMEDLKTKIDKSYKDCINNKSKQIVLNWGPYGGGKTFSANYFINAYPNITQVYVRSPKDGSNATDEFFKTVIDQLTFTGIRNQIKNIVDNHGEDTLFQFLAPKTGQDFAKAILLIASDDDEIVGLMNRYLYVGATKTDLKKLGLPRDIKSNTESIKFLTGILWCFIGDGNFYDGRLVMWVDEMEDLIYYSPKNYKAFSQVLRDLFDTITESFLVFLNFTLAEAMETTIELVLGAAVWSRITKKIRFKELTPADAYMYCVDLILSAQRNQTGLLPFNEALIRRVIDLMPVGNITPREINKHFGSIITYTLENDLDRIEEQTILNWAQEFAEDNS